MANRKKKRKPRKNSNSNQKYQREPLIIIQKQSDNKAAWIILIAEILKFITLAWTEIKEVINLFSSM